MGLDAIERLRRLGLVVDDIHMPLSGASSEARVCTDLDSPGMAGYTFWSRSNRLLRERLLPQGWSYSNAQQILRTIHPSGEFAITAGSGSGLVGDESASWTGEVRTKNPKGPAVARLVQFNFEQLPLFSIPGREESKQDINAIPTWFLLYKSTREGLTFELSLPVEMHGKFVDTWRERIILPDNPFTGPEFDIRKLDQVIEEIPVEVPVAFKGAV
ncbi:hypothetical protein ACEZCY_23970 [Streptacidiphilus sp. N1-12]|uniref:Uncharacterized protein n=2 Tax=Streptacidiphilus alkalitolerans TaxID=3342712 RepID=A0ABV6WJN4_9ACTN